MLSASHGIRSSSSLSPFPNNKILASIHRQNCIWGSGGIQHHTQKDLGGISPTRSLGSGQRDLSPACGSAWSMNQLKPLLAVSWDLLENCLRQSPTDERAGNTGFWKEVPAHQKRKKKKFGHTGVDNRNSLTSSPHPKQNSGGPPSKPRTCKKGTPLTDTALWTWMQNL